MKNGKLLNYYYYYLIFSQSNPRFNLLLHYHCVSRKFISNTSIFLIVKSNEYWRGIRQAQICILNDILRTKTGIFHLSCWFIIYSYIEPEFGIKKKKNTIIDKS